MQPPSFPMPNSSADIPPVPPVAPVAPGGGIPAVPQPAAPTPSWDALATQPSNNSAAAASPAPTASTSPAMADDGDLIEKDWVIKAKQIVQSTAQDPYEQNKQFTQLRAEYMQKRYGKQIKAED